MNKEETVLFDKAYAIASEYSRYLVSEAFTLERYHGNYGRIAMGVTGACARKILLAINAAMIKKGILPFSAERNMPELPTGSMLKTDEHMDMQLCMNEQILGVLEALGWEFEEYDFVFPAPTYEEGIEVCVAKCRRYLEEYGMSVELLDEICRRKIIDQVLEDTCWEECEGKMMVYTNDRLSDFLLNNSDKHVEHLAGYFKTLNIYNMQEQSMFWYRNRLYYICFSPIVYAEESGRYVDSGDYYLDLSAPYYAVELDNYIGGKNNV